MNDPVTELDFDGISWHDNIVYGLRFDVGDACQGDWRHDLIFDIDYIVEWVRGGERGARFRVAPAILTFHDVTDLRIAVDFGDSDCNMAMKIPVEHFDKVFIGHPHVHHMGDLPLLWIGGLKMNRTFPMHVWGPSGATPEMGTKAALKHTQHSLPGTLPRLQASATTVADSLKSTSSTPRAPTK